ncbi:MAG TPA: carbohydrate-binding family 9-like protein [Polyangia bacterium]|jgi:hypothetical protein
MRSHALLSLVALALTSACVEQAPDTPSEADLTAAKQHILKAPPAQLKHPVNAELEGKLVYLGCDTDAETLKPGQAFTITHYWKVIQPVSDDWKMFVHLNGQGGKQPFVNLDHGPVGGKYPVAFWKAGEIVRDVHRVTIPANWASPKAEIYTGVWKGNLRLKVTKGAQDGQNRVLALSLPVAAAAAAVAPKESLKRYVARKVAAGAVKLDGKLDEQAWKDAPSTGLFVNTINGSPAPQQTEAKLLWDEKNLYVGFEVKDTDIWGTFKNRDDELWKEEAVELFIDWSGTGKNYVEIQVNPRGTIFDSFLTEYRKHWQQTKQYDYDSGVVAKVTVDGTLDNRKDTDKGWVVELAIPLAKLKGPAAAGPSLPPKPGDTWRINLFRVDRPGPAKDNMQASAWSAPMVGDFHAVKRFGELVFGDEKGAAPQKVAAAPASGPAAATSLPAGVKLKVRVPGEKGMIARPRPMPLKAVAPAK